jgi:hypothetical protein
MNLWSTWLSCCTVCATLGLPVDDPAPAVPPAPSDPASARKEQLLRELDQSIRKSRANLLGQGDAPYLKKKLESLPASTEPQKVFSLKRDLSEALLREGDTSAAIAQLEDCQRLLEQNNGSPEVKGLVWRSLGIANMRLAERQNCIAHHNPESCIFPLTAAAIHTERSGGEAAVSCFRHALELVPGDSISLWLLNLAHMTLGSYPDQVPAPYLIPPSAFASEYELPRFHDIGAKLGVNALNLAGGGIMDDFDNDGLLDILVSSMNPSIPLRLFRNNGDGTFTDIAEKVHLNGQLGGLNLIHGDIDNDGRLDILVLRGGWMLSEGEFPNSLLKQDQDGIFHDITAKAGIEVSAPTQTAQFADFDNDGDLDLFIGYESLRDGNGIHYQSRLYRNRGDGTFENLTSKAGVTNNAMCKGVAVGDYDEDRLPDIYISNFGAPNRLYHNNGDFTFTDVAEKVGVSEPMYGFPTWFFDYNNDGHLDLLATNYGESASFNGQSQRGQQVTAFYRDHTVPTDTVRLYEGDGHGGFRDVTAERGLKRVFFPMGSNFGDFDNDGYQDLYFGTGDPFFSSLWPNVAFRNDGGRRFQDVTKAAGLGHLQKGHGVAFGDLDNDGDQDMFVQMGGAYYDDAYWDCLFENPGNSNHWITVRLHGVKSNRFGVGARIRVRIAEASGQRDIYAFVGTGGSFGGNSLQQEMGLGQAKSIVSLEVYWPTSNLTQTFKDVALDQCIEIEEGAPSVRRVELKRVSLSR